MKEQLNHLIDEFLKLKTREEFDNFLIGLLTPKEIQEFSQRIEIIKLLKKQIPQHAIAKKLGVGVATVTRGAKELQKGRFITVK